MSFRGRSLLRLALNGYTQIQIEKMLFPIMNFQFSPCLEFLPCSQSFGKGTPFQKPQSVRYPAWMPYRNSLCSACRRILSKVNSKPVRELSLCSRWHFSSFRTPIRNRSMLIIIINWKGRRKKALRSGKLKLRLGKFVFYLWLIVNLC